MSMEDFQFEMRKSTPDIFRTSFRKQTDLGKTSGWVLLWAYGSLEGYQVIDWHGNTLKALDFQKFGWQKYI